MGNILGLVGNSGILVSDKHLIEGTISIMLNKHKIYQFIFLNYNSNYLIQLN